MKRTLRYGLLAGASGLALGFGLATAPAQAFDEVKWTWNANVHENVWKNVWIDIDLDPNALTMLENIQVHVGDLNAYSKVNGVYNNQHGEMQAADDVSFKFQSEGFDDDSAIFSDPNIDPYGGSTEQQLGFGASVDTYDTTTSFGDYDESFDDNIGDVDWGYHNVTGIQGVDPNDPTSAGQYIDIIGGTTTEGSCSGEAGQSESGCVVFEVTIDADSIVWVPVEALNAVTQLPEVVSAATAVANNSNLTSNATTQVHEAQFAFGGFNGQDINSDNMDELIAAAVAIDAVVPTGNRHHDALASAAILAQLGLISKGNINAVSDVDNIWNASVDSSATAVTNNKNITVEADTTGELALIADVTQFGYMDVYSESNVQNVSVNNYSNLGNLDRPLVNSVATSVGNNLNVSMGNTPTE
ncbi:hypothetical protein [Fodinicurvata sediminis]|uniref:hypothetical protein n=1 Tax=Fodinicurvata sediminis TaxID=1121832 RepID=UPI0003B55FA2|nr:hypothetical protein [Fodinicurvata sediminis]